ncbi:MAG: ABC transporter substrate-binding protein [Firmicutes bacterium]|nr:ABC transporter substrate-binding protein [Bacillota bacterium]HOB35353.1 ABC transporter substrate-binding protein [Bacillota bacterium]HPZ91101.1 ABC transporter substrate-binding protein [Bacillota bacterium]HQE01685.1 ABC transporter substrate-binding protein [Bacillota bacterium]
MSRFLRTGIVLAISLTLIAGCSEPQTRDSVVVAIPTDPDGFHPHHSVAAASAEIAFNIYEGLVKAAPDGSIVPALAEEWSVSADGLEYTFTLRRGVKFHNGREMTPDDVVYCLSRLFDPEVTSKAADFAGVKGIRAQGDRIIITLHRPDAAFLALLTEFGAVIYPPENEENLSTQPVGTGPFVLTDWQPNDQLTLVKFEQYWNPELPRLKQVILKIIPEPAAMVNSLFTGHVDLIPRLEPDYLHQVEGKDGFAVLAAPMNLVQLLIINNAVAPFDDLRVRQAMNYAVNREEIIQGAAWGKGTPIGSNLSPAMDIWYTDLTDMYPYDPQRAKELLAEAGYPDGFSATLHLPAPYPLHRGAGEILADQLARVGIDLKIRVIEWGAWLEQIYTNRDFELTVVGFTGRLDPHTMLNRYQSDSRRNTSNFSNAEYDELLDQGLLEADPAKRVEIYRRLQTILAREAVNIFIMDPNQLAVMPEKLKGWRNYPVYVLDLAALEWEK